MYVNNKQLNLYTIIQKVLKKTKEKKYGDSEFFKIKTKNNKHTNNSIIMWI